MIKKIERMHLFFGVYAGYKCKDCSNMVSGRYHDKILHKCSVYGLTHSEASDWRLKYEACGMFNKEYSGSPVIRCIPFRKEENDSEPIPVIDGQITIEEMLNETT